MCEDVVKAPHVLDIANDIALLNYVTEFFGALPSVDYIGAGGHFQMKIYLLHNHIIVILTLFTH